MKRQICKNCMFYAAYYKQRACGYGRLNNGFCSKHQKPQTAFEVCEEFKSNEQKESNREKIRLDYIEQASKALIEIAQILKENYKE